MGSLKIIIGVILSSRLGKNGLSQRKIKGFVSFQYNEFYLTFRN